jgi:hypothetical protein
MALHAAEEATLRAFLVPGKRDRFLTLLGNATHRKKVLNDFNHFEGWDARCAQGMRSSTHVLATLRKAGAPDACYIISNDEALDGADLPLAKAIAAAELYDFASILCCIPGQLGFFFDEIYAPRVRLLLRRPAPRVK